MARHGEPGMDSGREPSMPRTTCCTRTGSNSTMKPVSLPSSRSQRNSQSTPCNTSSRRSLVSRTRTSVPRHAATLKWNVWQAPRWRVSSLPFIGPAHAISEARAAIVVPEVEAAPHHSIIRCRLHLA